MFCPNRECPDLVEDGLPGEYIDSVKVCPKCGATLVADWPPVGQQREATEPLQGPSEGSELPAGGDVLPVGGPLIAVAAYDYPDEAEPLVSLLVAHGLSVYQFFDDGRDFRDQNQVSACTRVLVPQSQAHVAIAWLEELEKGGG